MAVPNAPSSASAVIGRHPAAIVRAGFVCLAFVALILGYIGLDQYFVGEALEGRGFLNLLYSDLQLFVLGSDPLQEATNFPPALQVARFAAPAVTMFAVAEAVRLLLSAELRRMRMRNARGHAIVCGDSAAAVTLARGLAAARRPAVLVRSTATDPFELRRGRLFRITGDATDPDVLRGAGARRATTIYACSDDGATNVAIAAAAGRVVAAGGGRARVYAQIHDPDRVVALQARRLGVHAAPGLRLDFFNLDQLAVQVLLAERPTVAVGGRAPRLLVAGDAMFVRALLVALARDWRLRRPDPAMRAEVDLVSPDAPRVLHALHLRYAVLGEACAITAYASDVPDMLSAEPERRYDEAFLCYRDEEQGLQVALTAHELWHRVRGTVLVPVDRLAGLTDAFGDAAGRPLLDEVDGKIRLFAKNAVACRPELIAEDLVERLARLIHERYVVACRESPDPFTDQAALVDWILLDDDRRGSNRALAVSIGAKLHSIGCTIVARSGTDDFCLTPGEVEKLAEAEQDRWSRAACARGWRYGTRLDRAAKLSPYVRPWRDLPDEHREKTRAAVRDLPAVLADAGFQVIRLTDGRAQRVTAGTP
ncbi:NAD-binding protein [Mangrovihabitans endophyticus]|uniref:RCK N-terminal domain-containing protein n=1 Tax=Mangrovihabitans endophyticus TaxID=1751298 RepID=A0A8J3FKN7_9ACTN|nr:NAD-binding protein [Mangrovihabitans endophyticus]GGK72184.1 hypothetical protein GCM10012284_02490 [Mangrovihabitans endophyticus]